MDHLLLTPEEAAELLRVEATDVLSLLENGDLAGLQIAGHWRITVESVTEFLAAGLRKQNLKALDNAFHDHSRWADLIAADPALVQKLESESYPPGSMGAFLQEALAADKGKESGKVVPFKPRSDA